MEAGPGPRVDTESERVRPDVAETKLSFKSTEMWAAIVGVIALIVVYNASAATCPSTCSEPACLCTVLGAAYIVSRDSPRAAAGLSMPTGTGAHGE
jgi:hypothetical protein